jgi:hypothetical protein
VDETLLEDNDDPPGGEQRRVLGSMAEPQVAWLFAPIGLPTEARSSSGGPPPLKLRWATFARVHARRLVEAAGVGLLESPNYSMI